MRASLWLRGTIVAVCALGADAGALAAGPPRTSSLGWVRLPGAEACIGTRDLALAVEQRLGRSVFVPPARAEVFIEGRIAPQAAGQGYRAHLAMTDERGVVLGFRDLETSASDCRALDEQLGLVIALLIDPDAALAPPGPPRPIAPPPPAQPLVERVFVYVPVAPPPTRARPAWRERVGLGGAAALGLLPGAAAGAALRGEITPPSLPAIELGGAVWLDDRAENGPKGTVISLSYALLGLCPLSWRDGRTDLRGCAAFELGAIRAVGYGFRLSQGDEKAVAQAAVEARLAERLLGPLELELGLALVVPFERARFFYLDENRKEQELFRMSAVAGVLDFGLGVAFP